jgi:hypothetical protein
MRSAIMLPAKALRNALLILILLPAAAMANERPPVLPAARLITVDQVIAMTKAGVSDAVILALIDRDRPIFLIDAVQIVQLKQKGISEPLLLAMMATGYYWQTAFYGQTLPCGSLPVMPAPGQLIARGEPTSTRGIFFTNPTRGIFFAPVPSPGCR